MERKIRIAIVVSHPIQHFSPQYVSFAAHEGVEIKVFFASALGLKPYHDQQFNMTVSWNRLGLERFPHEFLNGDEVIQPSANLDAPSLENSLKVYDPEVVIIYGYYQKLQRRALRWARKNKKIVAYISDTETKQKRNSLKELIKFPLIRNFFSKIDFALTVGDSNEEYYKKMGLSSSQLLRMHFPIDIDLYKKSFASRDLLRNEIRSKYRIGEGDFVASVVGKLVPWKNQQDIIKAMHLLEGKGIYSHLFVIGSGETLKECQDLANNLSKSKVHFTGFVDPEKLPAYYAASDVYIHPAAVEPHSLAISEAIFMGCPVIISDTCGSYGPTDDVQEGRNGYVFPFGNIPKLAENIEKLITNKDLREKLGTNSNAIAVKYQQQSHYGIINDLIAAVTHV
ncbi:MAG TPA: glycosyltransferase family 4 protein [Chitinophagaceae bacterium]|nr:glycosyltransferase family 4 protein [Chitinophagaceae bacterium]